MKAGCSTLNGSHSRKGKIDSPLSAFTILISKVFPFITTNRSSGKSDRSAARQETST